MLDLSRDVLVLEPDCVWEVGMLYSSGFIPDYGGLSPKFILAFRLLRERLQLHRRLPHGAARRLYLARNEGVRNGALNDNAAGASRVILNHAEVLQALEVYGFETVTLGASTLREKAARIAGAGVIVSPLGANLINCLFLSRPFPRTIVILHSDAYNRHGYMAKLINRVLGARIRFRFVQGRAQEQGQVNSPWELDMGALASALRFVAPVHTPPRAR